MTAECFGVRDYGSVALWNACILSRAVEPSDDALFVRGDWALPAEPFRLPMLAQT